MRTSITLRRRHVGINAGSMADIAFLLLIFFLVTTTMDLDVGLQRLLAPNSSAPPGPVHPRNMLAVQVNAAGELLVNGQPSTLDQLHATAMDFLTNPDDRPDLPQFMLVTEALCLQRMAQLGAGDERSLWEQRMEAVKHIGPYREPPASAQMTIQTAGNTPYAYYIMVQDVMERAVNDQRNALAKKAFRKDFSELLEHDPQDRQRIAAIRRAFPLRIGDLTPVMN
ncbi:MAG: biopolymer transporter ExbD [Flavobacteriales bacterium]|nr:biopolymer transporter ExbD [Flavobacteriales bacterium]